jgi:hypothetical protein
MKVRRIIPLAVALVAAFLLAFPLRGLVESQIILPAARVFWMIQGFYASRSQSIYWILALLVAVVVALVSLRMPDLQDRFGRSKRADSRAAVAELAFWLQRRRSGDYPRWYVAHILSDLAGNLLSRRDQERHARRLAGSGWNPPEAVARYLNSALNTTYADVQRRKKAGSPTESTFNQDLDPVISYLESYLESDNDNHS